MTRIQEYYAWYAVLLWMVVVMLSAFISLPGLAQEARVISVASGQPLEVRWEAVRKQAQQDGEGAYWVGYRIERLMERRAFVGSWSSSQINADASLYARIGELDKFDVSLMEARSGWNVRTNGYTEVQMHGDVDGALSEKVLKDIGILFYVEQMNTSPTRVLVSNMSLEVALDDTPLYWIDYVESQESLTHLIRIYDGDVNDKTRKRVLSAIGLHDDRTTLTPFYARVLRHDVAESVQKLAAYWLGQQDTREALDILLQTLDGDATMPVKKKAIYALSHMTIPEAMDAHISFARSSKTPKLRKEAIFWLGRRASKRALDVISDTIYNEADAQVQKHALHALSQFENDTAVPLLITIATEHPSVDVRKRAIYILGDSGDTRAVEALVDMARGYP